MTRPPIEITGHSASGLLRQAAAVCGRAGLSAHEALELFEKTLLVEALEASRGNSSRAARALGMHRNTLRRNLDELGLSEWLDKLRRRAAPRRRKVAGRKPKAGSVRQVLLQLRAERKSRLAQARSEAAPPPAKREHGVLVPLTEFCTQNYAGEGESAGQVGPATWE